MTMQDIDVLHDEELLRVARRVNWYTSAEKVIANTPLFLSQIMARGGTSDIIFMNSRFSVEQKKEAYLNAPPGLFDRRAWAYWGLVLFDNPKAYPLPERFPNSGVVDWRGNNKKS